MNWFFITVGYSGLAPKAPGTVGTIVSLPLGLIILSLFGSQTLFLASILITLIAVKAINTYEQTSGIHDDKRIVIDELVGMWIALAIAPAVTFNFEALGTLENGLLVQTLLSFIFFRIYDIKKPSIIGRIDRETKGGIGVMGDDIIAGFAAGISSIFVWLVISKILL